MGNDFLPYICISVKTKIMYYTELREITLVGEIWVDVWGYEGTHAVSNYGRFRSLPRTIKYESKGKLRRRKVPSKILKQHLMVRENGRVESLRITLTVDGVSKTHQSSRLIWKSFNRRKQLPDDYYIIHLNKDVTDNRLENLIRGTKAQSKSLDMLLSDRVKKSVMKNAERMMEVRNNYLATRTTKTCSKCGETDDIAMFEEGKGMCDFCLTEYEIERNEQRKEERKRKKQLNKEFAK